MSIVTRHVPSHVSYETPLLSCLDCNATEGVLGQNLYFHIVAGNATKANNIFSVHLDGTSIEACTKAFSW